MDFGKILAGALLSIVAFGGGAAQAATFPPGYTDLGYLSIGASGDTNEATAGGAPMLINDYATGYIPAMSMITFTYSIKGVADYGPKLMSSVGSYNYEDNGNLYKGSVYATSAGDIKHEDFVNGVPSGTPLVFATANLFADFSGGVTTITNLTNSWVNFATMFLGILQNGDSSASYHVSAVPLPAALPLFGIGLAGLVGVKRLKKNRKAV